MQQKNQLQQNEMDRIRTDNIKLYEKIKFLQNYSGSNRGAAAGPGDDTEARYSAQYEQKLDPFTHFNKKVNFASIKKSTLKWNIWEYSIPYLSAFKILNI